MPFLDSFSDSLSGWLGVLLGWLVPAFERMSSFSSLSLGLGFALILSPALISWGLGRARRSLRYRVWRERFSLPARAFEALLFLALGFLFPAALLFGGFLFSFGAAALFPDPSSALLSWILGAPISR